MTEDVIATGSEDGMIRVMQIQPNKFCKLAFRVHVGNELTCPVGVIATHEDYPIERMRLDRRQKWLGSVSHDECIKLTDVENMLEDSDDEGGDGEDQEEDDDEVMADSNDNEEQEDGSGDEEDDEEEADSDSDVDMDDKPRRNQKEGGKGGMGDMGRTHKKAEEGGFFDDL